MLLVILLVLLLILLYLFLIAPDLLHRKISRKALFPCNYAHRGLHDKETGIPENSVAAFRRAAALGYGIELDVHLTKDRQLVVIHDHSAERMCGYKKMISDMTLEEIRELRLNDTQEAVPTFDEALNAVGGKVPLMVELKSAPGMEKDTDIAVLVNARMQSYRGPYCVESFNPLLLRWYKKHAPQVFRGQLASGYNKGKREGAGTKFLRFCHANLLTNFLSRPDFISYDQRTDRNLSFRLVRSVFRPTLAVWTVRSQEELAQLDTCYDGLIFEGFTPHEMIIKGE